MIPRIPKEPPPQVRGGFFRALGQVRAQQISFASDFNGAVPTASSSPRSTEGEDIGRSQSNAPPPRTSEERSASLFLDKLQLKFIETIWVEIKKNCMLTKSGRGAGETNETINLKDFLRVSSSHMHDCTTADKQYLERLYHRVDRRKKGAIRTTDIATALILISNADPIPKLRSLFKVFDSDDDSCLMMDEIFDMYLSIKVNNITRTPDELLADALFDDELSLQEAKRLYELTVVHLKAVSDFIIFDEFKHIFNEKSVGRFLLEHLLPGAFSLEWILNGDVECPNVDADPFGTEVRKGLVIALRRGEEHLELSKRRGRGTRIMQNCLSMAPHRAPVREVKGEPVSARRPSGGVDSLPKLQSANERGNKTARERSSRMTGHGATASSAMNSSVGTAGISGAAADSRKDALDDNHGGSDSSSSDEEDDAMPKKPGAGGQGLAAQNSGVSYSRTGASAAGGTAAAHHGRFGHETYSMEKAKDIQQLPLLNLNHSDAKLFRSMKLDAKTQQAYLRDRNDVNRTHRYNCLVCAVNHDFTMTKIGGGAEHQH